MKSQAFIYDDSGEAPILGAQPPDGPGTLRSFFGEEAAGVWMLTMVDNTQNLTGRVDQLAIRIERAYDLTNIVATIPPQQFFFDSVDVPPEATNLTVSVGSNTLPVELCLRKGVTDADAVRQIRADQSPGRFTLDHPVRHPAVERRPLLHRHLQPEQRPADHQPLQDSGAGHQARVRRQFPRRGISATPG
jgi:hypothetical protein